MVTEITALINQTPIYIDRRESEEDQEELVFYLANGNKVIFSHDQECCESVYIEDIVGNLDNLLYTPILQADEKSLSDDDNADYESVTFTFYTFATKKGYVDIRWVGESNGYYSESVDLVVEPYTLNELPPTAQDFLKTNYPELTI